MSTAKLRKRWKYMRFSSGFVTNGAIVINPLVLIWGRALICETSLAASSGITPYFVSSFATFTSIKISAVTPFLAASFSIVSARRRESTEWTSVTLSIIYFTLFRCRCPIICQEISAGSASYLSTISCTLFSPKIRFPRSYASCSICTGFVLLTAIRVTSSRFLPARSQAACILASTSLKLSLSILSLLKIRFHYPV